MNFISREQVIAILREFGSGGSVLLKRVEALPFFPAPNPDWRTNGRNVMGQQSEEFQKMAERSAAGT